MIITFDNYKDYKIGAKAENLFRLMEQGFPVPRFFCVYDADGEQSGLDVKIGEALRRELRGAELFSVRSSSSAEDGKDASFAGQFRTYLRVPEGEVCGCVRKVQDALCSPGLRAYCEEHGISGEGIRMTVIVQEMIGADVSGVLFTSNPQGILNETVIVAGRGTGENVVEDRTDTTTYYYNRSDAVYYYERQEDSPVLPDRTVRELVSVSESVRELFGLPCDIEFAIKDSSLYLLQARPITTTGGAEPVILDNSNIVESYPGITLPLTQSFVREVYYRVFQSCLLRLTGDRRVVEDEDPILRSMVDAVNGRIYYRISNWYDIILLLPFHKRILPVWQEMLGVRDRTVTFHQKKPAGIRVRLHILVSFFVLLAGNQRRMEWLDRYFADVQEYYRSLDIESSGSPELLEYYQKIKDQVAGVWDLTLVNDMYSFIFTGLLKARLKKGRRKDPEQLLHACISQIANIESLKPVKLLAELAARAGAEGRLEALRRIESSGDFYAYVEACRGEGCGGREFAAALTDYIEVYGDRSLEELKLESRTFRTDPVLLVQRLLQYADEKLTVTEQEKPWPKTDPLTRLLAGRAAAGIRNRERSRMNRGRLYGMMRSLMRKTGENLCREGRLADADDIFWLYYEEVERAAADRGYEVKRMIEKRKAQYEGFRRLPAYSRLVFDGRVLDKNPGQVTDMDYERTGGILTGVPCSPGVAEGEVLLVERPSEAPDTAGKILVTKMTDPGWVFLIAAAGGIIAEKGSLLSHTAIVARELGKPAVAAVSNATRLLKTGDHVRLDGDRGEVEVIHGRAETHGD